MSSTSSRMSSEIATQPIPATTASSELMVLSLTALINAAYAATEADFVAEGVERTTATEVRRRLRAGELHGAFISFEDKIVGVVRLHFMPDRPLDTAYGPSREYGVLNDLWDEVAPEGHAGIEHSSSATPKIATFSMLAVDRDYANRGIGNALVQHLEDAARNRGCEAMEIQVQDPLDVATLPEGEESFSRVLRQWYHRRGYVPLRNLSMDEFLPGYRNTLARPVQVVVMRKEL